MIPYKEPYVVKRTLNEVSNMELESAWWEAFYRDKCGDVEPDILALRDALLKLLEPKNE